MSDHKGYASPAAAGYGGYLVVRFLWGLLAGDGGAEPAQPPAQRVIITPPPNATRPPAKRVLITPPPKPPPPTPPPEPQAPPLVRWTADRELIAWRAWRLALLMDSNREDYGPRLLSLSAPCIWDGPAIRADVAPLCTTESPSGIYTLKPDVAPRLEWIRGEHCWVMGTVALSGRVVEHALGYRAERVVIRELRIGVGTHLVVRRLDLLRTLTDLLEERYQAPVDAGLAEREIADRMLTYGFTPQCPEVPFVWPTPPWRLV